MSRTGGLKDAAMKDMVLQYHMYFFDFFFFEIYLNNINNQSVFQGVLEGILYFWVTLDIMNDLSKD